MIEPSGGLLVSGDREILAQLKVISPCRYPRIAELSRRNTQKHRDTCFVNKFKSSSIVKLLVDAEVNVNVWLFQLFHPGEPIN